MIGRRDMRSLTEQLAELRAQIDVLYSDGSLRLFRKQTKDGVPYDAFRTSWPFERERRNA